MPADAPPLSASATVTLEAVTAETVRRITALEVSPDQRHLVSSNADSIAEAYFEKGAWFRALYAAGLPVGFVMLYDPTLPGVTLREELAADEVVLWRFMVDRQYQGLGFGRQALDLVRAHVRGRPGIARLSASYVPGPEGPEGFYLKYGFAKTGRLRNQGREVEVSMLP